jgi:ketosteroid isomerase-like protein
MRLVHGLAAATLVVLLSGCQQPQTSGDANAASETMSAADRAADEQAIKDLGSQMVTAAAAKDAAKLGTFYADGGRFMAPNAPIAEGPAAISAGWASMFELPGVAVTWSPTMVHIADGGDLAYDVGTYNMSFDDPKGKVTDTGKYLTVWSKVGGQWKIVADMFNSDIPVPAAK